MSVEVKTARLLIYGSRTWAPSIFEIQAAVTEFLAPRLTDVLPPIVVISGNARGADRAGEEWARAGTHGLERFPADWNRYGKAAGPRRNAEMALECTHAIGFRDDGESRGTDDMTGRLKARGVPHLVLTRADVATMVRGAEVKS